MSKDSLCCGVRSTSNASLLITSLIDTGAIILYAQLGNTIPGNRSTKRFKIG